jgi:hypothetical protein
MSRRRVLVALSIAIVGVAGLVHAAGINTSVALPVRKGGYVYRTQLRFLSASDDPTTLDREIDVYAVPNVLVYGVTARTTLFGILPYLSRSVDSTDAGLRQSDDVDGFGDLRFLVRQTVHARDALQRTSRLGLLAGLEIPLGKDEFSSHSTDYQFGAVYTLQDGRHELDADLTYKINTEGRGRELGDEVQYNLAYEVRISPWEWPERGTPSQIYLVIEANGKTRQETRNDGMKLGNTGGTIVFLSPGIQLVTRRVIYEGSIQIPVVQDLNGTQVGTDFVAVGGIRVQF